MSEVLIVGTGALATLFAARLGKAGHSVSMLGTWQNGLQALRGGGARLVGSDGRQQAFRVNVQNDPHGLQGAGMALVLVKAWQTERAARQLEECLAPDGLAVTLQNGLGNHEVLIQRLGAKRVAMEYVPDNGIPYVSLVDAGTVWDDDVAKKLDGQMGKRVVLHYREFRFVPTTCFGETNYFVDRADISD